MEFVAQWYFLDLVIVIEGETRESILLSILGGESEWIGTLDDFLFYSSMLVSDGLLIWRCFIVWRQPIQAILVPSILVFSEFGLFVTATTLEGLGGRLTSLSQAKIFKNFASALVFASLGTTVSTTFLIGYKIHSTSRSNGLPSQKLFNHVVALVIESAAAYSFVLFVEAISTVVPAFSSSRSAWYEAGHYWKAVLIVMTGMAPIILVARVALTNPNDIAPPSLPHISSLHFQSQQTNGSGEDPTVIMYTDNPVPTPAANGGV